MKKRDIVRIVDGHEGYEGRIGEIIEAHRRFFLVELFPFPPKWINYGVEYRTYSECLQCRFTELRIVHAAKYKKHRKKTIS